MSFAGSIWSVFKPIIQQQNNAWKYNKSTKYKKKNKKYQLKHQSIEREQRNNQIYKIITGVLLNNHVLWLCRIELSHSHDSYIACAQRAKKEM